MDHLTTHAIPPTEPIGVTLSAADLAARVFHPSRIRNFSIVAHIDHGKTTLSDAILRRTNVLDRDGVVGTFLDKLPVEKERGITVKAQTCTLFIHVPKDPSRARSVVRVASEERATERAAASGLRTTVVLPPPPPDDELYMLNLIDTPGHVDFTYEVSRSLGASDGAVLLVDATQGVEAQTIANLGLALDAGLVVVPALTKLDACIDDGQVDRALVQMEEATALLRREVFLTAARRKLGIEALLRGIVAAVPPPSGDADAPLRALIFDAWALSGTIPQSTLTDRVGGASGGDDADASVAVVCLVRIIDGCVARKDVVTMHHSKRRYEVKGVGVMHPEMTPTRQLRCGQVGFLLLVMRSRADVYIGDTVVKSLESAPVPGFKIVKPMVFAGFYPADGERFDAIFRAVEQLCINDPSVTVSKVQCEALGCGLQLGFLGMLHMGVFQERLLQEFHSAVLVTPPQVVYRYRDSHGTMVDATTYNFKALHEGATAYFEPVVNVTIVTPHEHYNAIQSEATAEYRAVELDARPVEPSRVVVRFRMPLADLIAGFFARVKSISHGYASVEYDDATYEVADLVKLDVVVNKCKLEALSVVCVRQQSTATGRRLCRALKDNLGRVACDLPIQVVIGNKIIARETLGGIKKDVTVKCHGGDPSRKNKKLMEQKKGQKATQKTLGDIVLDQDTMIAAMGATLHNEKA